MAQYNTFFIPHGDDGDAQKRLNDFLASHRVCQVDKAVLEGGWTFCVEWLSGDAPSPVGRRGGGVPKVDYMKVLPPDVFARFATLRERRREIALGEKISAFLVATDAQLAEMAKNESPTLGDWRGVDGFGDERIAKYGARLLGLPPTGADGRSGSEADEEPTA